MAALTIGLPFYNSATTLRLAVESVRRQTFQDWELILIDDGSTDGSSELLDGEMDGRMRLFRHTDNRGLAYRLNQITGLAKGEFVARMDADDLMHPRRIERQLEVLRDTGVNIVTTDAFVIDDTNRVLGGRPPCQLYHTPKQVLRHNGPIHATMLARREFFCRSPYKYLGRAEDLAMWVTTIEKERLAHVPERLYFIRENPDLNLPKYYQTLAAHRQVFRQYAPGCGGVALLAELYCRSYIKEYTYRVAARIGATASVAARRRVVPLETGEKAKAQITVDAISMAIDNGRPRDPGHGC
jgi:glycosyltransferase involved in cell wall biosynthesis